MTLTIAPVLHPFSHRNGALFLLPCSGWQVRVYPTRLILHSLETREEVCIDLGFVGPWKGFTVEAHFNPERLHVFGHSQLGFVRYYLYAQEGGVWIDFDKLPQKSVDCLISSSLETFKCGPHLLVPSQISLPQDQIKERLFLGVHKAQDIEKMQVRLDLKELLPLCLCLGQKISTHRSEETQGMFSLLRRCQEKIKNHEIASVGDAFRALFQAGFSPACVPRLYDEEFQGIVPTCAQTTHTSPLMLLAETAITIRSLFFQEKEGYIALLPCLLPEFHCGRFIHVMTSSRQLSFDFEWTKKTLRRVRVCVLKAQRLVLSVPKGLKRCRFYRQNSKQKAKRIEISSNHEISLDIPEKMVLWLDQFES